MADEQKPDNQKYTDVKKQMAEAEGRGLSGLKAEPDTGAHPDLTPAAVSLRTFLTEVYDYLLNLEAVLRGTELSSYAVNLRLYADRAIAFRDTPYDEFIPNAVVPETRYDAQWFDETDKADKA